MSNRRSLGEARAIEAVKRVQDLIESTGSDYVSVYAVAAAIQGIAGSATPTETWHHYVPWPNSTTADGFCRYCGKGSSHTNHYATYPQPSAGRATQDVEAEHRWFGMENRVTGEKGNCAIGLVIPDDGTSDPCGLPYDHPIHQRGADPVALPHVDNGYGDCIGCGIDDETGNSRSSSADCHVQRATQGCVSCARGEDCERHTQRSAATQGAAPEIDLQKIPMDRHPAGCRCTFHSHRARKGCGLTHPHTATTKCPG